MLPWTSLESNDLTLAMNNFTFMTNTHAIQQKEKMKEKLESNTQEKTVSYDC